MKPEQVRALEDLLVKAGGEVEGYQRGAEFIGKVCGVLSLEDDNCTPENAVEALRAAGAHQTAEKLRAVLAQTETTTTTQPPEAA